MECAYGLLRSSCDVLVVALWLLGLAVIDGGSKRVDSQLLLQKTWFESWLMRCGFLGITRLRHVKGVNEDIFDHSRQSGKHLVGETLPPASDAA